MKLWQKLISGLIEKRLVVFILVILFVGGGVIVSPFGFGSRWFPELAVPVDAIPDIGENQQIVFTEWAGRSPRDIEDQITYPLTSALLGVPGVKSTRSASAFGFSTIYVIFEDNVEFYWSRSRVLEKLASLPPSTVPEGVTPTLGPDATALGQVFWYTLEGQDSEGNVVGGWGPDELRSIQDWTIRPALQAARGVSEVASIGGFVREYQVDVNPDALDVSGLTINQLANAVRKSNLDIGARTIEVNQVEYIIRGLGQLESIEDLLAAVVATRDGTPIRVRDVAKVSLGPANRRGALDDSGAPVVGGVVVARFQANPKQVIDQVKAKIAKIAGTLPERTLEDGTKSKVTISSFYDRSQLIDETIGTLREALFHQILVTIIVILFLLRDLKSSFLVSLMIPLGVMCTFLAMKLTGVGANIMALGGIAIAIGSMVDIAIVFVENIGGQVGYGKPQGFKKKITSAAAEVAPAVTTSVLTTVVSFLPILGLGGGEYKLFAPLVFTKTFAMSFALVLSLLLIPCMAVSFFAPTVREQKLLSTFSIRYWLLALLGIVFLAFGQWFGVVPLLVGTIRLSESLLPLRITSRLRQFELLTIGLLAIVTLAEAWRPLSQDESLLVNMVFVFIVCGAVLAVFYFFERVYPAMLNYFLVNKVVFMTLPIGIVLAGAYCFSTLKKENMPSFDEGAFLYMPTTMPHGSMGANLEMLSNLDASIAQIPEVDRVVGKIGRVESALDPAPLSMVETLITYKPKFSLNKNGERVRNWRKHIQSTDDIWKEIVAAAKIPGLTEAPLLMPIETRLVMLQTGMRSSVGMRIQGPTIEAVEKFGLEVESLIKTSDIPEVNKATVFAERIVGKPYLEIDLKRESLARYGLAIGDIQAVLQIGVGGIPLGRTIEGRERYPLRVRFMRDARNSIEQLKNLKVPTNTKTTIRLSQVADIKFVKGPQSIKSEDTRITSYLLFSRNKGGGYSDVEAADAVQRLLDQAVHDGKLVVPEGVTRELAGEFQKQIESEKRLMVLVPIALVLVFLILYLQFSRVSTVLVVFSSVVVAVSGAFILMWLYNQTWFGNFTLFGHSMREIFRIDTVNLSVATWVGVIALVGIATDDGVVMATYLSQTVNKSDSGAIKEAVQIAGKRRIRACLMTTATTVLALLPVLTSQGRGADVMLPMAIPVMGGMLIELVTLFVVPVLYCGIEEHGA